MYTMIPICTNQASIVIHTYPSFNKDCICSVSTS